MIIVIMIIIIIIMIIIIILQPIIITKSKENDDEDSDDINNNNDNNNNNNTCKYIRHTAERSVLRTWVKEWRTCPNASHINNDIDDCEQNKCETGHH